MNREIKFRGKRLDNGKWVFGDLMTKYPHHEGLTIVEHGCVYHEVDPKTVGQYTGLKDKHGGEIYEDDIVRPLSEGYGDAYFDEGQFWINWSEGLQPLVDCYRELTVVGNIHDNPELLEA